ncbi:MAG: homoserine O-succinyltransferase [Clostridia bacterium]|nr:homoserine O-succinyltransferase [Clostridia bacterium]
MPVTIPQKLPARRVLEEENIFVMDEGRAKSQDIRPLRIAILNLMPTKIVTETQLLRLLSNTPLQLEITFLQMESHTSKNTSEEHLLQFYQRFSQVKDCKFDGLIITGAPVEQMKFEEVDYWDELCELFEWARKNVHSNLYICWGAQAGLYYRYGIEKRNLKKKLSGVYSHSILSPSHELLRGFDEEFLAPHSRYTTVDIADVLANEKLELLSASEEAGAFIIASKSRRNVFVTGHVEYDADTLSTEYFRDVNKGIDPEIPENYFPDDDPTKEPKNRWRSAAHLLFSNWLNYFVYQQTPYDITTIEEAAK